MVAAPAARTRLLLPAADAAARTNLNRCLWRWLVDLADCILEQVELQVADAVATIGPQLADLARKRAPVDTGATRDSVDWEPRSRFELAVTVDTIQGAIQDAGSGPHPIRATRSHGILTDGAGFWVGGSATNPATVIHPGSTKHKGWFSDIDWDGEVARLLATLLG